MTSSNGHKPSITEAKISHRNAWNLLFASQIVNIGFGLIMIFIPLLGDEIHLHPGEIGLIISIFMVSRAIAAAQVPGLSDKIGRKKILVTAIFIYSISTIFLGFARDFLTLFLLRIIEGAATGAAFPTAEALLVDSVPPKERGAWMGKYFTTFNIGFVIGPGLGGILYIFGKESLGLTPLEAFAFPFLVTGLFGMASFFAIIFWVSDVLPHSQTIVKKKQVQKEEKKSQSTPYYHSFLTIAAINGFAIGLVIPVFALHIQHSFNLETGLIGFIFTISGTVSLFVNYPAGKLSDKVERMYIVFVGMFFMTISFVGVGLATSLTFVIAFFILRAIAIQAFIPAYRAFQADQIPVQRRGEIMGKIQSSFNVGAFFGPLIGAFIYEIYEGDKIKLPGGYEFLGGGIPFLLSAAVGFLQLILAFYILTSERTKKRIFIDKKETPEFPTVREIISTYSSGFGAGPLTGYETFNEKNEENQKYV